MYISLILQHLTNFVKPFFISSNLFRLFEIMLYNPVNNISDMLECSLGLTSSKQRILFCLFQFCTPPSTIFWSCRAGIPGLKQY